MFSLERARLLEEGFGYHRAQLIEGYAKLIDAAEGKREDREVGQGSLFAMSEEEETKIELAEAEPWSKALRLANEKLCTQTDNWGEDFLY